VALSNFVEVRGFGIKRSLQGGCVNAEAVRREGLVEAWCLAGFLNFQWGPPVHATKNGRAHMNLRPFHADS